MKSLSPEAIFTAEAAWHRVTLARELPIAGCRQMMTEAYAIAHGACLMATTQEDQSHLGWVRDTIGDIRQAAASAEPEVTNIIERTTARNMKQGLCDTCGLWSSQLTEGLCQCCRDKYQVTA